MYLILKMIILTFSCGPKIWRGAWWNKSGKREDILTRDPTCSSCESIRRVGSSLGKGDLDHLGFEDLPVIPRTTYHTDLPCFTLYKISDRWLIEITRITFCWKSCWGVSSLEEGDLDHRSFKDLPVIRGTSKLPHLSIIFIVLSIEKFNMQRRKRCFQQFATTESSLIEIT